MVSLLFLIPLFHVPIFDYFSKQTNKVIIEMSRDGLTGPSSQCWNLRMFFFFYLLDDEMFSDSYPIKLVDGVLYEVTGKVKLS